MLQITTTNGDTLIHADQRPDTYNGQSFDGSQYMVHAGEWGRHKYIRKEGNRYIYPEDMSRKERKKIKKRDAQFIKESQNSLEPEPYKTGHKTRDQITSAHQQSTAAYKEDPTNVAYQYRIADGQQQAALKKERDFRKQKAKEFTQINSAHRGSTNLYDERDDIGNYKNLSWRDGEKNRAIKEEERRRHKQTSEQVSRETEFKKKFDETDRQIDQFGKGTSSGMEKAKRGTEQRKKAKEILDKGFSSSQAEEERRKAGTKASKKRPKSRQKKIVSGGLDIKKGSKVNTNGRVGSR